MPSELLTVPEEHIEEMVRIIQAGMDSIEPSEDLRISLMEWCEEQEEFLQQLYEQEDES